MEDEAVTITLPIASWRIVVAHVEGGVYREVCPILAVMYERVNAQISAHNARLATEKAEASRQAAFDAAVALHRAEGVSEVSAESPDEATLKPLH